MLPPPTAHLTAAICSAWKIYCEKAKMMEAGPMAASSCVPANWRPQQQPQQKACRCYRMFLAAGKCCCWRIAVVVDGWRCCRVHGRMLLCPRRLTCPIHTVSITLISGSPKGMTMAGAMKFSILWRVLLRHCQ